MPIEFWGATEASLPDLPRHLLGYLLLLFLATAVLLFSRLHTSSANQDKKQPPILFPALLLGALVGSQLLVWRASIGSYWLQTGRPADAGLAVALLSAVFLLLAPLLLTRNKSLLIGLAAGLGYAVGQTGELLSMFHPVLFVLLAAACLQQSYAGNFYRGLRQPLIAGLVATLGLLPLLLTTAVFQSASQGTLAALDIGLATMIGEGFAWLLASLVGGTLVTLLQYGLPMLQPQEAETAVPLATSLNQQLRSDILLIGGIVLLILTVASFSKTVWDAQALVLSQMAINADTALAQVPQLRDEAIFVLKQVENSELLRAAAIESDDPRWEPISENNIFETIVLLNREGENVNVWRHPDSLDVVVQEQYPSFANLENVSMKRGESESLLLVSMPITGGQTLLGIVSPAALNELVAPVDDLFTAGNGFLFDNSDSLIIDTDESELDELKWDSQAVAGKRPLSPDTDSGTAYIGRLGDESTRHLVYETAASAEGWQVVATVPYTVALGEALGNSLWLGLLLLGSLGLLYVRLNRWGKSVTQPIAELATISQRVAAGDQITPTMHHTRQDEIGQLSHAFSQMQQTIERRLSELNLLLDVSNAVSSSMVIQKGLPKVLAGVLKGTEAVGVRVVLLNQVGNRPLIFTAGEAAEAMERLDRRVMKESQHVAALLLPNPAAIRDALSLKARQDLPVAALCALPIQALGRFQGVLWLGYADHHQVDSDEHKLLETLARQTAVLVENAILFARAEGGRRQLKAVLSSTSNAVIVTDPTGRVSLVNPAFEAAFGVSEAAIKDRPLAKVVESPTLVQALQNKNARLGGQEITTEEGRTFFANISTINTNDGQTMGRVAVLQDITAYKEADELKSEFVATVSHDLRSPLTFMRGFATMLPMVGDLNDRQSDYVFKIMNGIDQMSSLVEDLLDLRRIDEISRMDERVDVAALLRNVAAEYRHLAEENGMGIEVAIEGELTAVVGDEKSLHSAIVNLVENGIKYAPNGEKLLLSAYQTEDELVMAVKDEGPGIPKKDLALIFEQFYRVKQQGEERIKGSGLGLALVKKIAQRHGGRVWCESEKGQGSTFVIALPLPENSTS